MQKMTLGRTGLQVCRTGFGCLPIQRTTKDEAVRILRKAQDNGIDFYDTARAYSDSEEKLGEAFHDRRNSIIIATKSWSGNRKELLEHVRTSLKNLRTDHVDILQLHNPGTVPDISDSEGAYEGLMEAKKSGMIRFAGISCHIRDTAITAVKSGLFDTLQYPLSSLSSDSDLEIINICREHNVGLIAMKALAGGLITEAATSFAFLRQFENVIPIWGIQHEHELDEFLAMEKNPPILDDRIKGLIGKDRKELGGKFCRGCGYCQPCSVGIPISMAARMAFLLRRAPFRQFLTDDWKKKMELIASCTECGSCKKKCPYGLDTPGLLKIMLDDYRQFYLEHGGGKQSSS